MENRDNVTPYRAKSGSTRKRILEAAFMEIYRKGFQGMRLDDVLQQDGIDQRRALPSFSQ